ncbi:MAG: hypothetical protein IPK57_02620 [Chitinophagaceae bacterium]|nr:hypothetical protein [Chitinophagaceae bacterium]
MKRIMKIAALAFVLVLGSSLRQTASAQYYDGQREVSYQTFYDELSPYGRWIDYPGQGYVWVPDAGPDFRPYSTNGHWVWTDDYEWMWVSDYDWGWGPFHYGRWDHDPFYGWYWVPGYEWSPAWVAWRDGGDYYGWAPIRPGINISINFNIGRYSPPYDFWCFAPRRYIASPRIHDYYIDRRRNVTIINQTVIINNYNYSRNIFRTGPRRADVEIYTGRITPVRFRDSYQPGRTQFRNNEVSVYRPNIRRDDNRSISPRQFERYDRNNAGARNGNNDNNFRGNGNETARTDRNNRPDNRDRADNSPFRRNDNSVRQPQNNGGNNLPDRRRIDRTDNNSSQPNREGNTRVIRPTERPDRNSNPGNNSTERRQFERRNDNGNTNSPVRQPEVRNNVPQRQAPRVEQRRSQEQPRQFERRNDISSRQPEARNNNSPQRQTPQVDQRRTQEQPRQFERRNESNNRQERNSNNNGNGSSRNRRG